MSWAHLVFDALVSGAGSYFFARWWLHRTRYEALRRESMRLTQDALEHERQLHNVRSEVRHWQSIATGAISQAEYWRRRAQVRPVVTTLPDSQVDRLIQLCHPDKHAGSRTATEVTQWLLEMRAR